MPRGLTLLHQPQALMLRQPWHLQALSKTSAHLQCSPQGSPHHIKAKYPTPMHPWHRFNILPLAESIPLGLSAFGNGWPSWGHQPNLYAPSVGPSGPSIPGLCGEARPSQPHRLMANTSLWALISAVDLTLPNDPRPSLVPLGEGQWHRTAPLHHPWAFMVPSSYGILGECQAPSTQLADSQHSIMGPYRHCRPHPTKVYSGLPMSIRRRPLAFPGPLKAIGTTTLHHPQALPVPLSYALLGNS